MNKIIQCEVELDEYTNKIVKCFDYDFSGTSTFSCWELPELSTNEYNIGLIVGSSGSGKSTLLKEFGTPKSLTWSRDKSIASHFNTPEEAIDKLSAVGLNSIPSWVKPFHVLSEGEKFRARLALSLDNESVIDEYTSVVDRNVAKACSVATSKYIKSHNLKRVVFASCHKDIIEWLEPDWVFDTDTGILEDGRCLRQRPSIKIDIYKTNRDSWGLFRRHHYLNNNMNVASRCYLGCWNNQPVCFSANLALPSRIPPLYEGDVRNKFRESRLVVLPDYQGMGIGTRFSNVIGELFLNEGYRYFSKTAHIRMGEYRQKSELWRPTSTNLKSREKSQKQSKNDLWHHMVLDTKRLCYSHEYIGSAYNKYRIKYEESKLNP